MRVDLCSIERLFISFEYTNNIQLSKDIFELIKYIFNSIVDILNSCQDIFKDLPSACIILFSDIFQV